MINETKSLSKNECFLSKSFHWHWEKLNFQMVCFFIGSLRGVADPYFSCLFMFGRLEFSKASETLFRQGQESLFPVWSLGHSNLGTQEGTKTSVGGVKFLRGWTSQSHEEGRRNSLSRNLRKENEFNMRVTSKGKLSLSRSSFLGSVKSEVRCPQWPYDSLSVLSW